MVVPLLGLGAQAAMHAANVLALLDPLLQPRPFAQERFVRELDGAFVDGDDAAVGEQPGDADHVVAAQLGERDASPFHAAFVIERREPQQDPPGDAPLRLLQPQEGGLAEPRDGSADAAGAA